jgi:hypothetical protein
MAAHVLPPHRATESSPSKELKMLRTTPWIYRLGVLAALLLAAGAGHKW